MAARDTLSLPILLLKRHAAIMMKMKMKTATSEEAVTESKIENIGVPALNNVDYDEEYSLQEQRKIIHRIDRRLVTMTGLSYCISLMDRTNLSMAAVAG